MENKSVCKVCSGKGGWKIKKDYWFEESWQDCLYCNTFGFVKSDEIPDNISLLLAYNGYKKIIIDILEDFGKVISYSTENLAEKIEISYLPNDRTRFVDLTKRLLKFGHYNDKMELEVQQVFFFDPSTDKLNYYWRILLRPDDLKYLDGFVDFIRAWEK